jgi:glutathione synthase
MKSLFVMDPLERLNLAGDSTVVTMRESCDRGHPVWFCTPDRLYAREGAPGAVCRSVKVRATAPVFETGPEEALPLSAFDVVWMRKDPPFDLHYIFACYVLAMAPGLVVNDPAQIVLCNEKLWAMTFPDLHPPTLLSRDLRQIREFAAEHPRIVLKPWDGNGGRGIVVTDASDKNLGSLVELLTDEGRRACIAQAYVEAIALGDKRVLLFDGEPVGAILRVPGSADHRGNMHVGARVQPTELTARDRAICARIGPELARRGMVFVGIDVIGDWLTEINVTSPTGIQEANRLYGLKLEADLVDRVERRVERR